MTKEPRSSSGDKPSSRTLTERVRARVAQAGRSLDTKTEGRARPRRPAPPFGEAGEAREAKSIDRVYCEMRTLYRSYRRRTKRPAVPELRQAVRAYKQGPSLTKLVAVASFLDDRSLLDW
ncbi:MAG: hypothetical protein AB7R55_07230 [Gemmatimonadales bacterium]